MKVWGVDNKRMRVHAKGGRNMRGGRNSAQHRRYNIYEAKGEELYMNACRPALTCHWALGLRGFVCPLRRDHEHVFAVSRVQNVLVTLSEPHNITIFILVDYR